MQHSNFLIFCLLIALLYKLLCSFFYTSNIHSLPNQLYLILVLDLKEKLTLMTQQLKRNKKLLNVDLVRKNQAGITILANALISNPLFCCWRISHLQKCIQYQFRYELAFATYDSLIHKFNFEEECINFKFSNYSIKNTCIFYTISFITFWVLYFSKSDLKWIWLGS